MVFSLLSFKAVRLLAALVIPLALMAGTYAFTASNTTPTPKAGDGAGTVSGYTITNVHYTLNASDPRNIDSVGFDVDSTPIAGSTIKVKLVAAGSTWYSCTNVATAITCATTSPQATVVSADELRVVIAD